MSGEIIQSVAYDNYDDFSTYQLHIFHTTSFRYFENWELYIDETDLRVR
jgi:hypothetical protein